MSTLKEWAERKKCVCRHPERYACAELMLDHSEWRKVGLVGGVQPCECPCHDSWEDDDDR